MSKIMIVCLCLFILTGCGNRWVPDKCIETNEEAAAVQNYEIAILTASAKATTLSGHDQDWDDFVRVIHYNAVQTCCKTRYYEYTFNGARTGRMSETLP